MSISNSPLRYPGGKQILARVLAHLIKLNEREGGVYVEPYAGGAGAALALLYGEHVDRVMINDADPCIYAFWKSLLDDTDDFVDLVQATPLTDAQWSKERDVYRHPRRHSRLRVGFATFFLNRCNHSGIIASAGPIGGRAQTGRWKIDARFNREMLAERIRRIAIYRERIDLFHMDAVSFLRECVTSSKGITNRAFVYLDPPYYVKGRDLYLNYYKHQDHLALARYMRRQVRLRWVMSYDNVASIQELYRPLRQVALDLGYSAGIRRTGRELLIAPQDLKWPSDWLTRIPDEWITRASRVRNVKTTGQDSISAA